MPYIGNPSAQRFTSPRAASVFSGDGSTTAFTLEEAVATDEDILVSVDGVIQEPSVAYAVSSGTTLTFTAAPSSNSGNNIFVYYIARTLGSVSMPDGQNVNAAVGSFSGTLDVTGDLTVDTNTLIVDASANSVGIGASPDSNRDLHIKRTGANASILIEETSATNFGQFIELKDSSTSWFLANRYASTGSGQSGFGIGTSNSGDMLQIDTNGAVTMPSQPAFHANKGGTDQSNIATGTVVDIVWSGERFDKNADFDLTNNRFTAPVTGTYFLQLQLRLEAVDIDAGYYLIYIATSNESYYYIFDNDETTDPSYYSVAFSVVADMDANDTAEIKMQQSGGAAQTDIDGDVEFSWFSGYLVA